MKTVEKEFVGNLRNLLEKKEFSKLSKYYINKIIEIFNNENVDTIDIINLTDYSDILDYFNYEGYNRGLLLSKILINNCKIINSNPYSMINFFKYRDIYEKRNISCEQFLLDVRHLINSEDKELDSYKYEIYKMLESEEKIRLKQVKEAQKIKKDYENLDIEEIVKYLESINLRQKDIEGIKLYFSFLKEKKLVKESVISMDLKVNPIKLGYTNKEIKEFENDLNTILKEINENERKISYEEYLKYVKYVLILEQEKKACDADIDQLYDALYFDNNLYNFLIMKAKSLLQTKKAIDIQNILQDIDDINSIMNNCKEDEKEDFNKLLDNMYLSLYYLDAYNHVYERKLYKESSI